MFLVIYLIIYFNHDEGGHWFVYLELQNELFLSTCITENITWSAVCYDAVKMKIKVTKVPT
jgi:hypothetical protein